MKFEEYMRQQNSKMKEEDKLLVFGEIKNRIQRQSIFSKISFYTKVSVYSLLVFFVIFGMFIQTNNKQGGNLTIDNGANTVNADYIWKVVKSKWEFEIINNKSDELIKKWDIVSLSKKSNITLKVSEWIILYLVWPAKLKLDYYIDSDDKKIYTLNMLDWNYLTVKSNSINWNIILKSDLIDIESNNKLIDLKYEKKWNAMIVENNGWNVVIKNDDSIYSLKKEEKLILWDDNIKTIKDILKDDYRKYSIDNETWEVKIILKSKTITQLDNILEKKNTIIAVWRYVLWKTNKDNIWTKEWKEQLIKTIDNTYNILNITIPRLLSNKIESKDIDIKDLQNLVDNLINEMNKNYILLDQYVNRLKVILSYLVIVDKMTIKEWTNFENLSSLVNNLNIDKKYKEMLLKF